jgi:hypothetical protein
MRNSRGGCWECSQVWSRRRAETWHKWYGGASGSRRQAASGARIRGAVVASGLAVQRFARHLKAELRGDRHSRSATARVGFGGRWRTCGELSPRRPFRANVRVGDHPSLALSQEGKRDGVGGDLSAQPRPPTLSQDATFAQCVKRPTRRGPSDTLDVPPHAGCEKRVSPGSLQLR